MALAILRLVEKQKLERKPDYKKKSDERKAGREMSDVEQGGPFFFYHENIKKEAADAELGTKIDFETV